MDITNDNIRGYVNAYFEERENGMELYREKVGQLGHGMYPK